MDRGHRRLAVLLVGLGLVALAACASGVPRGDDAGRPDRPQDTTTGRDDTSGTASAQDEGHGADADWLTGDRRDVVLRIERSSGRPTTRGSAEASIAFITVLGDGTVLTTPFDRSGLMATVKERRVSEPQLRAILGSFAAPANAHLAEDDFGSVLGTVRDAPTDTVTLRWPGGRPTTWSIYGLVVDTRLDDGQVRTDLSPTEAARRDPLKAMVDRAAGYARRDQGSVHVAELVRVAVEPVDRAPANVPAWTGPRLRLPGPRLGGAGVCIDLRGTDADQVTTLLTRTDPGSDLFAVDGQPVRITARPLLPGDDRPCLVDRTN